MKNQPDEKNSGEFKNYRHFQLSEQLKPLLSLVTFKIVCNRLNSETTPDLKKWLSDTWSRKSVGSISLLVKDNLKSPPVALL